MNQRLLAGALQRTALVIGSLVICFLALEFVFKAVAWVQPNQAGPSSIEGLPYENTPGAKFWRFDREAGLVHYAHNSFGMRGPETTLEKSGGKKRIAFLGDSVLHGGNVQQAFTTPAQLGAILNARLTEKKVETLNFGVASFGLHEYSILLKEKVMRFSPYIVMVGLCLNDYVILTESRFAAVEKNSRKSGWTERYQNLLKSHFLDFLKTHTGVDNLFRKKMTESDLFDAESLRRLASAHFMTDAEKEELVAYCRRYRIPLPVYLNFMTEYMNPEVWTKNEAFIREIIATAAAHQSAVYFYVYPVNEQVLDRATSTEPQDTIRHLVEQSGGRYIELLDEFRSYRQSHPEEKIFPNYDNAHMFATGHRIVAETLAKRLAQDGVLA